MNVCARCGRAFKKPGIVAKAIAAAGALLLAVGGLGVAEDRGTIARIEITSPVEVRGTVITLGDIASVNCPRDSYKEDLPSRLRGIEIGRAPFPGQERTLSLAIVRIRLRQAGFDPDQMVISGPTTIVVRTRATPVTADAIAAAVRDYMTAAMPWDERDAEVSVLLDPNERVLVPDGEISLKVEPLPTTTFIGTTSVRATVLVDGEAYRVLPVRVRVDVAKAVVVAARTIQRHEIIGTSDVRLETRDLTRVPQDVAFDTAAVVGMRASHTITAGEVLARSSVERPPLVRKGDAVTIEAALAGVTVASPGEALEDGCEGARIRVRNTASGAIIRAMVISAKVVRAM
ncbi:MAG: flagellar basal body P-ring formation chaperone FlgA [Betaproteobacteria bacterium]